MIKHHYLFSIILKLNITLQLIAYGELMMHGQLAAKLVGVVYKSEHEKSTRMLIMAERYVLVFLLNNKTVVQTHVLQVILLISFFYNNISAMIKFYV